jgi:hypothetical protein|tara:strand:+ start:1296 stop:1640 length:345 start_codon:yes stop_codon:yes gene_type:complete
MQYNSDFKYDLEVGQAGERLLGEIIDGNKIEVKYDLKARTTTNVFVEYESRGKPSGIATTEADWYAFVLSESSIRLCRTKELKALCRKYIGTKRDVCGGDSNTSRGILLPLTEL